MVSDDRGRPSNDDEDDEPHAPVWSAPRTTPGAMGAALDDVFGVPSPGAEPDPDAASTEGDDGGEADADGEADAETDVERDARSGDEADGDRRSTGAASDVEGKSSGGTEPDGDGSRASRDSTATEGAT